MGQPLYSKEMIMDARTPQERSQMFKAMGVMNAEPPLPHSPCLKNVRTGIVLPWNELLAAQRDLVVCCDENGNTDPEAWESKVVQETTPNEMLLIMAQQSLIKQNSEYEHPMSPARQVIGPSDYDQHDVVPYSAVEALREKLNAHKPADTGSVEGSE